MFYPKVIVSWFLTMNQFKLLTTLGVFRIWNPVTKLWALVACRLCSCYFLATFVLKFHGYPILSEESQKIYLPKAFLALYLYPAYRANLVPWFFSSVLLQLGLLYRLVWYLCYCQFALSLEVPTPLICFETVILPWFSRSISLPFSFLMPWGSA